MVLNRIWEDCLENAALSPPELQPLDVAGSFQRKPLGWLGCGHSSFLSPECRGQNPWKPVESARKEFDSNQISLI